MKHKASVSLSNQVKDTTSKEKKIVEYETLKIKKMPKI